MSPCQGEGRGFEPRLPLIPYIKMKTTTEAQKITFKDGKISVPNKVLIPFIEGDGTGSDIWRATKKVLEAAVKIAFNSEREISWVEVLAGQKAFDSTKEWLPKDTIEKIKDMKVAIKGPLTTPTGGGIRSLNVALRQIFDLYACIRPVRYFEGVSSPVKKPELVDLVIFRENIEDVYSGIEFKKDTKEVKSLIEFLKSVGHTVRADSGIGIKPISEFGSKRLVRKAIQYALQNEKPSVTLVHKGNIQKFTEGAFCEWGYELAASEFKNERFQKKKCMKNIMVLLLLEK